MDFQRIIMRLGEFWADQGCLLWQPYNVQVGAGTMNPATFLRVLGPEPWNVGYVEPSIRPADGRYGENPNRWQQFYQYQVILKPDPGNPQELYLESLRSLGIQPDVHDIRFVEDNWESPALGAWGLGWEVWLDGQEISQYTYFQQAGGINLDPVSVELTYGLERIAMVLQGVQTFLDIRWGDGLTYGDILLQGEVEHCTYNFETADVDHLHKMYDLCEAEAENALEAGLVLPAHDYILKCSHIFNVLDARGAVGVTERANYFVRMRSLAQRVANLMFTQREELGHPFKAAFSGQETQTPQQRAVRQPDGAGPFDFVLEIGSEELPVADLDSAIAQLEQNLPKMLDENRLGYQSLEVSGTPRRVVAQISGLEGRQPDEERVVKGPSAAIAYDDEGQPTRAAQGFSRSRGVGVEALERRMIDGKEYVVARFVDEGEPTGAVLARMLPELVAGLHFGKSMRWNESGVSYSRPIRWILALLGDTIIPFEYAGVVSGRVTRGIRPQGSPQLSVTTAREYPRTIVDAGIILRVTDREAAILEQAGKLADEVDGELVDNPDLLREVANLVEYPLAIRGAFDEEYLRLPEDVLLAVMRKHQRYLPIVREGALMPYYVAVANGQHLDVEAVRHGNQEVLRARYADAAFFYDADTRQPLEAFTARLETLTFEEHLGSVLDKVERLRELAPSLADMLSLSEENKTAIKRAAALCKSDLATQLVVELTSLQGKMGHHYALLSGEREDVALAIEQHYLPRSAGDVLPSEMPGTVLALADRLDTLMGLFAVGNRPTGAADPWGLRRSALGVVRLLVEKEISLDLRVALKQAAELLPVEVGDDILDAVLGFIATRYENYLRDLGYAHDAVQAVLGARKENPYLAYRALQELVSWIAREDWDLLLDSYSRCVRITRDREQEIPQVDISLLQEPASRDLYEAYQVAQRQVRAEPNVKTLLASIAEMVPAIQRFYDEVLVMAEDDDVRANRLALVKAIGDLTDGIVDLSLLEGF